MLRTPSTLNNQLLLLKPPGRSCPPPAGPFPAPPPPHPPPPPAPATDDPAADMLGDNRSNLFARERCRSGFTGDGKNLLAEKPSNALDDELLCGFPLASTTGVRVWVSVIMWVRTCSSCVTDGTVNSQLISAIGFGWSVSNGKESKSFGFLLYECIVYPVHGNMRGRRTLRITSPTSSKQSTLESYVDEFYTTAGVSCYRARQTAALFLCASLRTRRLHATNNTN